MGVIQLIFMSELGFQFNSPVHCKLLDRCESVLLTRDQFQQWLLIGWLRMGCQLRICPWSQGDEVREGGAGRQGGAVHLVLEKLNPSTK